MRRSSRPALACAVALTLAVVGASCSKSSKEARPPATDSSGSILPPEQQPPPDDDEDEEETTTTTFLPRTFSVLGAGDILLHNLVIQSGAGYATAPNPDGTKAYNFNPMFDGVREPITAADVAICHQETPIAIDNLNLTVPRTLSFNAPREIATALKEAGFDGCDTASNHTWDRLLPGVKSTLDVMDAAGLQHAGSARDAADAKKMTFYDAKGVKVGHLAYSYTIFNNAGPNDQVPPEAPWLKQYLWPAIKAAGIIEQAKAMKAAGADFIVVSIHWGDQYIHQPNQEQRDLAKALLNSAEIDLILGDHVHVVQPCEKINNKYVIYGMGNFLSNQSPTQDSTLVSANQDGSMHRFEVTEVSKGKFQVSNYLYFPTWVEIPGHKIVLASPQNHSDSYNRTVTNMNLLNSTTASTTSTTAKPGGSALPQAAPAPACDAKPAY